MARGKEMRPAELLVDKVRDAHRATGGRLVVLIDGPAASGKTTLGEELAYLLKAQLVSMDLFYPGWGGLEVGSAMVAGSVLDSQEPGWRRWDWSNGKAAEWHKVNPKKDIVIEGSGALSAANKALATYTIWIHVELAERKRRKQLRDGTINMEHWDYWAMQERAFFQRERPDQLADIVYNGMTGELIE